MRDEDPGRLATLDAIESLADAVLDALTDASRSMATEVGYCPALDLVCAGPRLLTRG